MYSIDFDVSGFRALKGRALLNAIAGASEAVKWGTSEIVKSATKNVMGISHPEGTPSPYPGKLPVTRISRELSKSIKYYFISPVSSIVFADTRQADYAEYVHDGTRYMAPRPFLREAINERRQAILNRFRYLTLLRVGK